MKTNLKKIEDEKLCEFKAECIWRRPHETSVKGGYRVTGYLLRDTSLGLIGTAKKKES